MFTTSRGAPDSWVRIEPLLQWAKQGFDAKGQREQLADALELHAVLTFFQGDIARAIAMSEQASLFLSEQSIMYGVSFLFRGMAHLLAGNLDAAWQDFLAGHRIYVSLGDIAATFASLLWLGDVCFARGEMQRASDYYHQALVHTDENPEAFQQQLMTGTGEHEPFFVSWAYHNLAQLSYEWNELTTAQQYLAQAQALGEDWEEGIHVLTSGDLIRARLLHRCGETAQAQKLLGQWERKARFLWVLRAIRAGQARLQLEKGNLSAVEYWYGTREHTFGLLVREQEGELPYVKLEEEALLLVRLYMAQEKAEEALQEVTRWKEKALVQGRMHAVLEMLILQALAHFIGRAIPQARSTLIEALRLAQPENYQRLFLDEGRVMQALLKSVVAEIQEKHLADYASGLLHAFEQEQVQASSARRPGPSALLEPLTSQEQRVLRLLAEGASNQQIATQLVIQLVTVKKHVTNLLGKLGAANRTQAIVRAREYGLL